MLRCQDTERDAVKSANQCKNTQIEMNVISIYIKFGKSILNYLLGFGDLFLPQNPRDIS